MPFKEDLNFAFKFCQEVHSYIPFDDFKDIEIEIIKNKFVDKLSYRRIAKKHKLSFSTIRGIIKEAKRRCPGLEKKIKERLREK